MDIILVIGPSNGYRRNIVHFAWASSTGLAAEHPHHHADRGAILFRGLGLGDFFFAGVLIVQTFNKFGKKTAFTAAIAIAVAFGFWEAFLQDIINGLKPIVGRDIGGFPGTVMIISGWAPIIAWKLLSERRKATKMPIAKEPPEVPKEQSSLPVQ